MMPLPPRGQGDAKEVGVQRGRRSRLDAESKMSIVLEGLNGQCSMSEVCRGHGVARA